MEEVRWLWVRIVTATLAFGLIPVLPGGPANANHAGRCQAAPTYMLVPHWVENEFCDVENRPGFTQWRFVPVPFVTELGVVVYDAMYVGDEFIGMLVFEVKDGKRRRLLGYSSAITERTYYAPGAGEIIEL